VQTVAKQPAATRIILRLPLQTSDTGSLFENLAYCHFRTEVGGLGIEVTSVDSSDAARLAQIRASTNLRMPDALVLNLAMRVGGAIATTDKELARVAASQSVGVFSPS
jgi:predicted nucleic acid-binding protein